VVLQNACCTHSSLVSSGVTGPKLTKFLDDAAESLLLLMHTLAVIPEFTVERPKVVQTDISY